MVRCMRSMPATRLGSGRPRRRLAQTTDWPSATTSSALSIEARISASVWIATTFDAFTSAWRQKPPLAIAVSMTASAVSISIGSTAQPIRSTRDAAPPVVSTEPFPCWSPTQELSYDARHPPWDGARHGAVIGPAVDQLGSQHQRVREELRGPVRVLQRRVAPEDRGRAGERPPDSCGTAPNLVRADALDRGQAGLQQPLAPGGLMKAQPDAGHLRGAGEALVTRAGSPVAVV